MTFNEIAPDTKLYVDANIFVYALSANLRAQTGFLVNDSVSLAMMQCQYITAIATNDRDFQRLNWLEVHLPTDL